LRTIAKQACTGTMDWCATLHAISLVAAIRREARPACIPGY